MMLKRSWPLSAVLRPILGPLQTAMRPIDTQPGVIPHSRGQAEFPGVFPCQRTGRPRPSGRTKILWAVPSFTVPEPKKGCVWIIKSRSCMMIIFICALPPKNLFSWPENNNWMCIFGGESRRNKEEKSYGPPEIICTTGVNQMRRTRDNRGNKSWRFLRILLSDWMSKQNSEKYWHQLVSSLYEEVEEVSRPKVSPCSI